MDAGSPHCRGIREARVLSEMSGRAALRTSHSARLPPREVACCAHARWGMPMGTVDALPIDESEGER